MDENKGTVEGFMKKGILIMLAFAILFVTLLPAMSYARGPGHHHGWGPRHHYRGPGPGYGWGIAGAAVGGLVLGTIIGSTMSGPAYVEPRRVYVAPPPPPPPPRVYYYYPPPKRVYVYPY